MKPLIIISLLFVVVILDIGCQRDVKDMNAGKTTMAWRDINVVKEANTGKLMSVPGVVGVYVGELEDHTPCIIVAVIKKTPDIEMKIPTMLESHPVRINETGDIKPME